MNDRIEVLENKLSDLYKDFKENTINYEEYTVLTQEVFRKLEKLGCYRIGGYVC